MAVNVRSKLCYDGLTGCYGPPSQGMTCYQQPERIRAMTRPGEIETTHYSKAPILEALIEVGVKPVEGITLSALDGLWDQIRDAYPSRDTRGQLTAQIQAGAQIGASASQQSDGFIYRSRDEKHRLQVHLNGFAFHWLRPYESWEPFRAEAERLWDIYWRAAGSPNVLSIGTRYINQLVFPSKDDLSKNLLVYPITDSISRHIAGFALNAQIPIEEMNGFLILQEALLPPESPEVARVLLDLQLRFPRDANIDLWTQIDLIRPIKNRVFQECLTDEMKESIK
jgi:uncharacterized protein (TIGR04255 family)